MKVKFMEWFSMDTGLEYGATVGNFGLTIEVNTGMPEHTCSIGYGTNRTTFSSRDLRDLEYAVQRLIRDANEDIAQQQKHKPELRLL